MSAVCHNNDKCNLTVANPVHLSRCLYNTTAPFAPRGENVVWNVSCPRVTIVVESFNGKFTNLGYKSFSKESYIWQQRIFNIVSSFLNPLLKSIFSLRVGMEDTSHSFASAPIYLYKWRRYWKGKVKYTWIREMI